MILNHNYFSYILLFIYLVFYRYFTCNIFVNRNQFILLLVIGHQKIASTTLFWVFETSPTAWSSVLTLKNYRFKHVLGKVKSIVFDVLNLLNYVPPNSEYRKVIAILNHNNVPGHWAFLKNPKQGGRCDFKIGNKN